MREDIEDADDASWKHGGPWFEPRMTGARVRSLDVCHAIERSRPASARAVSTAAQSRSPASRFGRKAFRPDDRTATEARVRFPSEEFSVTG